MAFMIWAIFGSWLTPFGPGVSAKAFTFVFDFALC